MKNKFFVIVWKNEEGQALYFEHEESGQLDPSTYKTLKEPMGFFVSNIEFAHKFNDKWIAEAICAGYEGSHVESISTREVLK